MSVHLRKEGRKTLSGVYMYNSIEYKWIEIETKDRLHDDLHWEERAEMEKEIE